VEGGVGPRGRVRATRIGAPDLLTQARGDAEAVNVTVAFAYHADASKIYSAIVTAVSDQLRASIGHP